MSEPTRHPNRRDVLTLGVGAFVLGAIPLARRDRRRVLRRTLPAMGTLAEVAVVHADPRWASGAIDAAFAELRRVESSMTRFRADSEIGRANAAAAGVATPVGHETAIVVDDALRWAIASAGAFDPALGLASELWETAGARGLPPAPGVARRFAGRALYRAIERGRSRGGDVVVFHQPDVALDLGGIAKGYGVDRAADALRDWGITSALVNVGGDLYALGTSPEGDPWRVGVRDPDHAGGVIATLDVSDRAIATSGDYERGFTHAGRRYHHLLDPATGEPRACAMRSLTVSADHCMTADAAATALFGTGRAEATRLLAVTAPDASILHTA